MTYPVWARWAAYQWSTGKTLKQVGREVDRNYNVVMHGITKFIATNFPQYAESEWSYWSPRLTIGMKEKKQLLLKYFSTQIAPTKPPAYAVERHHEISPGLLRAMEDKHRRRAPLGRVFDPDEATAPRDVWLIYSVGPDGFDFMEPVMAEGGFPELRRPDAVVRTVRIGDCAIIARGYHDQKTPA